jgi:hypothetical protein
MTLRLTASDPLYQEWNELLTAYAALLNPACHWNLRQVDTDSAEYRADVVAWTEWVEECWKQLSH